MHPLLAAKQERIRELCQEFGVSRLEVFGSAARGNDFDPARSDVDLLVRFGTEAGVASWGPYFELRDRLAEVLGRPVDLVEDGAIRNPYLEAAIAHDRHVLYAA